MFFVPFKLCRIECLLYVQSEGMSSILLDDVTKTFLNLMIYLSLWLIDILPRAGLLTTSKNSPRVYPGEEMLALGID